jgi:hypothetical protein
MANLLTITKETDGYFTFVLNGDSANPIKNTRNDLLTVGNLAHFKTANGANLIKEQDVIYSNITIIDGVTSVVPTSVDDLFNELSDIGFFDWINGSGGSGGVNRFDELEDTFSYFGKDGQVVRVNESELKLETFTMPDVSYLSKFPTPLVAGMMLKVNAGATAYELVNALNIITQEIRAGYTETTPSEDAIFQALEAIQSSISGEIGFIDYERLEEDTQEFVIPTGKTAIFAIVNYGTNYFPETVNNTGESNTFIQTDDIVSFGETLSIGNYLVIFYQ